MYILSYRRQTKYYEDIFEQNVYTKYIGSVQMKRKAGKCINPDNRISIIQAYNRKSKTLNLAWIMRISWHLRFYVIYLSNAYHNKLEIILAL